MTSNCKLCNNNYGSISSNILCINCLEPIISPNLTSITISKLQKGHSSHIFFKHSSFPSLFSNNHQYKEFSNPLISHSNLLYCINTINSNQNQKLQFHKSQIANSIIFSNLDDITIKIFKTVQNEFFYQLTGFLWTNIPYNP